MACWFTGEVGLVVLKCGEHVLAVVSIRPKFLQIRMCNVHRICASYASIFMGKTEEKIIYTKIRNLLNDGWYLGTQGNTTPFWFFHNNELNTVYQSLQHSTEPYHLLKQRSEHSWFKLWQPFLKPTWYCL